MRAIYKNYCFPAALVLLVSGCSSVQLISNYDEATDRDAQALQRKFDSHLVSLQNSGEEGLKFKNNQKFYESASVDLTALKVRAEGIYKNKITIEQIDLATTNLAYLVLLNKRCTSIDKPLTAAQIQAVGEMGPDLSMDCNVDFGAEADRQARGEVTLERDAILPIKSMFNQLFGAIMAAELAKKRGDKSSKE
ncbi:hypothetical protein D3C87_815020 [compost metagenome]|uniref:hypothetical protein n=1 Tax=Achromobacter sp. Root83 TaxID=1736602 RepID=UPI0007149C61|nr:hypothetical protein [Achromobacter sp. Root83]KRC85941.1 hypothetical protein ASE30_03020 [Achromobacter sp. Root83]